MSCHVEEKRDALVRYENLRLAGELNAEPATTDLPLAGDRLLPSADDQRTCTCTDFSEEAIPERDPAYRLPAGTLYETQTVELLSAAGRLALARCLMQLGVSASRAAFVANL
jgi:hypothetical protein